MSIYYTVVHPRNPYKSIDSLSTLASKLQIIGLTGDVHNYDIFPQRPIYQLGYRFTDFIDISEMSSEEIEWVNISLWMQSPDMKPLVEIGTNYSEPMCPTCNYKVTNWSNIISSWYDLLPDIVYQWLCPNCTNSYQIQNMNWHNTACFASYGIRIHEIFRAPVNQNLLTELTDIFYTEFTYTRVHF